MIAQSKSVLFSSPTAFVSLVVCLLSLFFQTATSFSIPISRARTRTLGRANHVPFSIFDDNDQEEGNNNTRILNDKDGVDFSKFNPLSYKSRRSNSAYSYSGTQISLRKTRMTELTNELLNAVGGDDSETKQILDDYRDFLLEPLDDLEAVLDPDSIYTPQMSRTDRYEAYRASMDERVQASKNGKVRAVLEAMRDFVLSCEEAAA